MQELSHKLHKYFEKLNPVGDDWGTTAWTLCLSVSPAIGFK